MTGGYSTSGNLKTYENKSNEVGVALPPTRLDNILDSFLENVQVLESELHTMSETIYKLTGQPIPCNFGSDQQSEAPKGTITQLEQRLVRLQELISFTRDMKKILLEAI